MARLDRLGPAKEVAQIGAAIGREFSYALLASVARSPRRSWDRRSTVSFRQVCCSGRACRRKRATCSSMPWCRTRPMARCCASRDARYTPVSPKPSKANSPRSPRASPRSCAPLHRGWADREGRGPMGQGGTAVAGTLRVVEAGAQLTRALDQIAILPGTAALRREQINFQVALITPLMHVKGYAAAEPRAAAVQARALIERAEALGEPPEDPLLLLLRPLRLLGNQLHGIQWRCLPRSRGAVQGTRGKAKGDSPAHGGAWRRGNFLKVPRGGHRGRPRNFGSSDRALRSCRASSAGDAIWPRCLRWQSCASDRGLCGHLAIPRPRSETPTTHSGCRRDRSSRHADVRVILCLDTVYPLRQPRRGSHARPRACRSGRRKGSPSWQAYGMMNQGCILALTGRASDAIEMLISGIAARRNNGSDTLSCHSICRTWPAPVRNLGNCRQLGAASAKRRQRRKQPTKSGASRRSTERPSKSR